MADGATENSGWEQGGRFRPGQSGNPAGKPKGTRHKAMEMVEALLSGEAEEIARAVVEKAKAGEMIAARIILDRIAPPRKGRAVRLVLPRIASAGDLGEAHGIVVKAMAQGELTTDEAADAMRVLEAVGNAKERRDLEVRIIALEERTKR